MPDNNKVTIYALALIYRGLFDFLKRYIPANNDWMHRCFYGLQILTVLMAK